MEIRAQLNHQNLTFSCSLPIGQFWNWTSFDESTMTIFSKNVIIIWPFYAIIFFGLGHLPSQHDNLTKHFWRFVGRWLAWSSNLLIVVLDRLHTAAVDVRTNSHLSMQWKPTYHSTLWVEIKLRNKINCIFLKSPNVRTFFVLFRSYLKLESFDLKKFTFTFT